MTPSEIRYAYEHGGSNRHFFDRKTMRFFGDTMRSYGVRQIDGVVYLYRKPNVYVNVFGKWQVAGRAFFGAWRFDSVDGDLHGVYDENAKQALYDVVARN